MLSEIFDKRFFSIDGQIISLKLIDTYDEDKGALPFYWWNIVLNTEKKAIGKISLRIGNNYHSYYNGNIGYEIDETYRGHHYAYEACLLVLSCAKFHNMNKIYISCEWDNTASYKTIEKLGATLLETTVPPKDYIFYYEGISKYRIYELIIQ